MTIELTGHNAMMMHLALLEYSKHINRDTDKDLNELREIDRLIGYSGELKE